MMEERIAEIMTENEYYDMEDGCCSYEDRWERAYWKAREEMEMMEDWE